MVKKEQEEADIAKREEEEAVVAVTIAHEASEAAAAVASEAAVKADAADEAAFGAPVQLAEEEQVRAEAMFDMMDLDGSKSVEVDEILIVHGSERETMMAHLDRDGSASVDKAEWIKYLEVHKARKGDDEFSGFMSLLEEEIQKDLATLETHVAEKKAAKKKEKNAKKKKKKKQPDGEEPESPMSPGGDTPTGGEDGADLLLE